MIEAYRLAIKPIYLFALACCESLSLPRGCGDSRSDYVFSPFRFKALCAAVFALLIKNDSTHPPKAPDAANKDVEKQESPAAVSSVEA